MCLLSALPSRVAAQACTPRCLLGPAIDDDAGKHCTVDADCNYCDPNHPEFDLAVCNHPEVIAMGGMCHAVNPCVNFEWRPLGPTVILDGDVNTPETIDLGLYAVSSAGVDQPFASLEVILNWDPTQLRLLGNTDPCTVSDPCTMACPPNTYKWLSSTFPNDCSTDNINAPCPGFPENDGNAYYIALSRILCGTATPAPQATATASGLHITTFRFEVIGSAGRSSDITLPYRTIRADATVGSSKTRVNGNDGALTGVIPAANTISVGCALTTPDCNGDGIGDTCQLGTNDCNNNGTPDDCDIAGMSSADCNSNGVPDECELGVDCNASGVPDECELGPNDCNMNGIPDECDTGNQTSLDCNSNQVPDECELAARDCNTNMIPDDCDIANGTSLDCNGNIVPDECEPNNDCNANGIQDICETDCNLNSVPDDCDLATGTSVDCNSDAIPDDCQLGVNDCNANGIPDDCDIAAGTSLDTNGDGVPDECIAVAPDPLMATGEVAKTNRYLRFSAPPPAGGGSPQEVIRVRVVSLDGYPVPSPDVRYLGPPFAAPEEDNTQPSLTFTASGLRCEPFLHAWSSEGIISAYGAELLPNSVYDVQRAGSDCPNFDFEPCWSTPLTISTAHLGDIVAPFAPEAEQADFRDISAVVQKFLSAAGATIKAVAQVQPNVVSPDQPLDFRDITVYVEAFLGSTYPELSFAFGPCVCPSSVICGATSCSVDVDCGGGKLCVGGACMDQCGRCRP